MKLNPSNVSIIKRLLVGRNNRPLRSILMKLEPADIASLFGIFTSQQCGKLVEALFSINKTSQVLREVPEPKLEEVLPALDYATLLKVIVYSSEEDAVQFISILRACGKGETTDRVLADLDPPKMNKIIQFLSYPENSAGRLMNTSSVFCLPTDVNVNEALELLRQKAQRESIYYIYCVEPSTNEDSPSEENSAKPSGSSDLGRLAGIVSLRQLAISAPDTLIVDIIKRDVVTVGPHQTSEEIAKVVSHYDFIALPVVDESRNLMGIITIDDVLEIIQEQATADIYARAGLQEDDRVYTSIISKISNRIPWMILNLFLAAIASSVVSLFEDTMSELIILASLKNIVAGMGGNTAIQTLTVVTRGLATGDYKFTTYLRSVIKETTTGLSIGVITGILAGILTYLWKGNELVSFVICISMVLNSLFSSFLGVVIPIALVRFKKDPALGSGVIVTMATDIFSFFSFLGIATLFLNHFA